MTLNPHSIKGDDNLIGLSPPFMLLCIWFSDTASVKPEDIAFKAHAELPHFFQQAEIPSQAKTMADVRCALFSQVNCIKN
ncbi:MAG: hypothetical protein ABF904_07600 [Ethanoligenens sp.]